MVSPFLPLIPSNKKKSIFLKKKSQAKHRRLSGRFRGPVVSSGLEKRLNVFQHLPHKNPLVHSYQAMNEEVENAAANGTPDVIVIDFSDYDSEDVKEIGEEMKLLIKEAAFLVLINSGSNLLEVALDSRTLVEIVIHDSTCIFPETQDSDPKLTFTSSNLILCGQNDHEITIVGPKRRPMEGSSAATDIIRLRIVDDVGIEKGSLSVSPLFPEMTTSCRLETGIQAIPGFNKTGLVV